MSRSVLPEHILTELNNAKGFVDDHLSGNCGGGGGSALADTLSLDDFEDCYVPSSPLSAAQELRIGAPPLIQQAPSSAAATRLANTGMPAAAAGRPFVGNQGKASSSFRASNRHCIGHYPPSRSCCLDHIIILDSHSLSHPPSTIEQPHSSRRKRRRRTAPLPFCPRRRAAPRSRGN